ncbi:TetR/AcrR family transcriptional regulator [Nocardia sp. NPDC050710]|uniref:TetR/AcrR family transcriptional regulator n=1 Tax=Nocardia sp. NPDC050710 TaxID=3157220 RepID=UPI0033FFABDC
MTAPASEVSTRRSTESAPVTRSGGRRETRLRLLHAAADLFLTRGYTATTIDEIARHAGFTRGATYTYFPHKHRLAEEVAEDLCRHAVARIRCFQPRGFDHLVTTLATWAGLAVSRPGWVRLELDLAALRPASRADSTQRVTVLRAVIGELLAATADPNRRRGDPDLAVTFLLSVVVGMATQHANGLAIPAHRIRSQIELVLRATTAA